MNRHLDRGLIAPWLNVRTRIAEGSIATTSGTLLVPGDLFRTVRMGKAIVVGYGEPCGDLRVVYYDVEGPEDPHMIISLDEWVDFACWFRLHKVNRINDDLVVEPNPNIQQRGPWDKQVRAFNAWTKSRQPE